MRIRGKKIKITFDRKEFVKASQENIYVPQLHELKRGSLIEWMLAAVFILTGLGIFWYGFIALGCTYVQKV